MSANLMRHPVPALIWECWRLSRRWYLWVLPAIIAIDLFFMNQSSMVAGGPPGAMRVDLDTAYELMGYNVFFLNFTIAAFTTLLAITVGGRSGFPLAFEFRLPIKTVLLVTVPMLTLATLCTSLYFLPMLLCRLLFGIEFPLVTASALIATLVIMLLASSWTTTSMAARPVVMLVAVFNSALLFALLDPLNLKAGGPRVPLRFNPDIVALTPVEYIALAAVWLVLFGLALTAIRKQRHGDVAVQRGQSGTLAPPRASSTAASRLLERASDLLALPCPVSTPWRAELWLELKRHGVPVLLLSGVLALTLPPLFAFGNLPAALNGRIDYLLMLVVFLTGIGIALFNRRQVWAGYMSAFEGTRGMTTTTLALLQMLALGASMLGGMLLVSVSVYFSAGLLDAPVALPLLLQALVDTNGSTLAALSTLVMQLVIFLSAVVLFACVHTWSVVWGRAVPYGAGIVAVYALIFAFRVQNGYAVLEDIQLHMWGLAAAIVLLTLSALSRVLYLKILSPRAAIVTVLCWAAFVACSLHSLAQQGMAVASQAPELRALNSALLLLPLTLCLLLFWSYDRLRHR